MKILKKVKITGLYLLLAIAISISSCSTTIIESTPTIVPISIPSNTEISPATATLTVPPSATDILDDGSKSCIIVTPSGEYNVDKSFTQSCKAKGIIILAFGDVDPRALPEGHQVVLQLYEIIPDYMEQLAEDKVKLVIYNNLNEDLRKVAERLEISPTPESLYGGYFESVRMAITWQSDVLCEKDSGKKQYTIHELAHALEIHVMRETDWEEKLLEAYNVALAQEDRWDQTLAMEKPSEYWAYGVPVYFGVGWEDGPPGEQGRIVTRAELKSDHLLLYELIEEFFGYASWPPECPE